MLRRIVKLVVSAVLWLMDSVRGWGGALVGQPGPPKAVVLYYHAVNAGERARFAAQMDALRRSAVPVPADNEAPLKPGGRYAAVTFDDGFATVIEHALPELEARRIPATLFVPTGSWGRRPSWVNDPAARSYSQTVVTPDQVRHLAGNPLVTIGAHSVTHRKLVSLDDTATRLELEEPKRELERLLGAEVTLFSFPHGECNVRVIDAARAAGYRRVFSISPTWAFQTADEFVTGRVAAEPLDWPIEFWLKVRGAYRWRQK